MASFDERLVREVKKHKPLWNQNSKMRKEAVSREVAWTDIASALGATVDECQKRWRSIRDTYLKRKKRPKVSSKSHWNALEQEMSFLDGFLRPRTRSHVCLAAAKTKPEDGASPGGSASEVPLPLPEPQYYGADMGLSLLPDVAPPSPMPLPPPPSVKQEPLPDPDMASADAPPAADREGRGAELFCLSLSPQLKRLPPRERAKAEKWFLQILHGLECGLYDADVDPQASGSPAGNLDA